MSNQVSDLSSEQSSDKTSSEVTVQMPVQMLNNEQSNMSGNEVSLQNTDRSDQTPVNRPAISITQSITSVNVPIIEPAPQSSWHPFGATANNQPILHHVNQPASAPVDQPFGRPDPTLSSHPPRIFPQNNPLPDIPDQPTVFILRGVSGSGKTTIAKTLAKAVHDKFKHSDIPSDQSSKESTTHSTNHSNTSSDVSPDSNADTVAICCADDYFIDGNGNYKFDGRLLSRAHNDCMGKFLAAVDQSTKYIIIDNTHSEKWEYANYQTLVRMFKYQLIVIELVIEDHVCLSACLHRSSHGVQWSVSMNLFNRWQTDESAIKLYPTWSPNDKDHILRHDQSENQKSKQMPINQSYHSGNQSFNNSNTIRLKRPRSPTDESANEFNRAMNEFRSTNQQSHDVSNNYSRQSNYQSNNQSNFYHSGNQSGHKRQRQNNHRR